MRMIKYPVPTLGLLVLVLTLGGVTLRAQNTEGTTLQESPGIALVKPQSWSKESAASVLEFSAFVDRRAAGNAAAGYYEFVLPSGERRQAEASRVLKVIIFPDASRVVTLIEQADRDKIEGAAREMAGMANRFPAIKTYLQTPLQGIEDLLKRFDAGEVKVDGRWVSRGVYANQLADKYVRVLREEIRDAKPPGSFLLEDDARYITLRDLGDSAPKAKGFAAELKTLNQKLARAEERSKILKRLADPASSYENSVALVTKLQAAQPQEDPDAVAFLENWKSRVATASALDAQSQTIAAAIESELGFRASSDQAPEFQASTVTALSELSDKLRAYRTGNPPAALQSRIVRAEAVETVGNGFASLQKSLPARQFFEAKTTLDAMSGRTSEVGAASQRTVKELQNSVATRIDLFTKLRDEAKALADAGQAGQAVAKYEEALVVIPDASVVRALEELQEKKP